jgi:hypothetical protein
MGCAIGGLPAGPTSPTPHRARRRARMVRCKLLANSGETRPEQRRPIVAQLGQQPIVSRVWLVLRDDLVIGRSHCSTFALRPAPSPFVDASESTIRELRAACAGRGSFETICRNRKRFFDSRSQVVSNPGFRVLKIAIACQPGGQRVAATDPEERRNRPEASGVTAEVQTRARPRNRLLGRDRKAQPHEPPTPWEQAQPGESLRVLRSAMR